MGCMCNRDLRRDLDKTVLMNPDVAQEQWQKIFEVPIPEKHLPREDKHSPKIDKLIKLEEIPPLEPNVLELYVKLKKFDKHKIKLPMKDLNLPILGPYKFEDGSIYYGQMKLGKKHGYGRLMQANGSIYEGFWDNDVPHGYGRNIFAEGDAYEGQLNQGVSQGKGKSINEEGVIYHGFWDNDEKSGKGTEKHPNGDKFKGIFANDQKNGKGHFV